MPQSEIAAVSPDHLPRLDVLRAVAVLLVVFFHYVGIWAGVFALTEQVKDDPDSAINSFVHQLSTLGSAGVSLFFVISGFCIHFSVLRRNQAFAVRDFFWRRFLRIYPAYFIALSTFSLLGLFKILGALNLKMFLTHLLLVHNFFNHPVLFSINAAFWSLAVECQFYLLYPLVLWLRRRWSLKTCLFLSLQICLFEQIACAFSPVFTRFTQEQFCIGTTLGTWCTWILGACMAEAYVQRKRFFHHHIFWAFASLVLFIVGRSFPFIFEFHFLLDSFLCAVLMEIYLLTIKPLVWFERMLVPIGLISYSIYLWHQPLIKPLWYFLHARCPLPETTFWELGFFLPLTLLILAPIFVASYWLGEKNAPRFIRRQVAARATPLRETLPGPVLSTNKQAGAD